jgi:hypothetical protein
MDCERPFQPWEPSRAKTHDPVDSSEHAQQPAFCSMKITEDVRKYAAEKGISEDVALDRGMKEKSAEFVEKVRKFT